MAQTTTQIGRMKVAHPDLGFDTADGGVALHTNLNNMFKSFSDHIGTRYFSVTIPASSSTTVTHNMNQSLSDLRVRVKVNGSFLPKSSQESVYPVTQVSSNSVSIQNTTTSSVNIEVYIDEVKGIDVDDFDPFLGPVEAKELPIMRPFTTSGIPGGSSGDGRIIYESSIGKYLKTAASAIAKSSDCITWTSSDVDPVNLPNMRFIAYGNGKYITGCQSNPDGNVFSSSDGVTWSQLSGVQQTNAAYMSCVWSPALSLFLLVGYDTVSSGAQKVYTSPDGVTWTQRTLTNASYTRYADWSPTLGLFVVVCSNTTTPTQQFFTSPDGVNWTARNNPSGYSGVSFNDLVWVQYLGKFLALAGAGRSVLTSTDGITWIYDSTYPSAPPSNSGTFVWNNNTSTLMGIGNNQVYVYRNGVWVLIKNNLANPSRGVAVGDEIWVPVAGGTNTSIKIRHYPSKSSAVHISDKPPVISEGSAGDTFIHKVTKQIYQKDYTKDYITPATQYWRKTTKTIGDSSVSTRAVATWADRPVAEAIAQWYSICWSPELGIFCAVALTASTSGRVGISSDGISWRIINPPEATQWMSVCWSPELGLFCAVSNSATNRVMTSPDGITWTARTVTVADYWTSVCWSPELGLFCAVSYSGTNRIMTSPDGTTWTYRTAPEATQWKSVCWSPELGLFVAVSTDGTNRVMTSPDGVVWTSRTAAEASSWISVCWSSELCLFVAVAYIGTNRVMTSPDGITWTSSSASEANSWFGVTWSPELGLFCAVSIDGTNRVMTSANGVTWTARSVSAYSWNSVCWSPKLGIFVAAADGGTNRIMTSKFVGVSDITPAPSLFLPAVTATTIDASAGNAFVQNGSGNRTITVNNLADGKSITINVQGANTNTVAWTTPGLTQKTGTGYSNTMTSANSVFTLTRVGWNVFITSAHGFA